MPSPLKLNAQIVLPVPLATHSELEQALYTIYNDSMPNRDGKAQSEYFVIGRVRDGSKAALTYTLYDYDTDVNLLGSMAI